VRAKKSSAADSAGAAAGVESAVEFSFSDRADNQNRPCSIGSESEVKGT